VTQGGGGGRWFRRLLLGCLGGLVAAMTCVGGCVAYVFQELRSSEAAREALRQVQKSVPAREALGEPIRMGWIVSGVWRSVGSAGTAHLSIPVSGPKGAGNVKAEGAWDGREWRFGRLELARGEGTIDLLAPASAASKPPRLTDEFGDPASGWSTLGQPDMRMAYDDGRLLITCKSDLSHRASGSRLKGAAFSDGRVEVDVWPVSGAPPVWVGLGVRLKDNEGVAFFTDGTTVTVAHAALAFVDHETAGTVPPDLAGWRPRRLGVLARGSTLTFQVDGRSVATVDAGVPRAGEFALLFACPPAIGDDRQLAFDHFHVWSAEP
jgi:hypothetical protein